MPVRAKWRYMSYKIQTSRDKSLQIQPQVIIVRPPINHWASVFPSIKINFFSRSYSKSSVTNTKCTIFSFELRINKICFSRKGEKRCLLYVLSIPRNTRLFTRPPDDYSTEYVVWLINWIPMNHKVTIKENTLITTLPILYTSKFLGNSG